MPAQPISSTTLPDAMKAPDLTPAAAWSRRVRRSGGFIQAAFAAFGPQARRIERSVTVATVIELVAAFILPLIVIAAGHSDWVLPSIVITIGPLAAVVILLATTAVGFHDLAGIRAPRLRGPASLGAEG